MTKQFLIALLVVIVAGGAYVLWQGGATPEGLAPNSDSNLPSESGNTDRTEGDSTGNEQSATGIPATAAITYSGSSYSPAEVTIKKGGTVTWTNGSDRKMWVASAQHPTHVVYAGTSLSEHCPAGTADAFDQCEGGDSYSFTFNKVGTWWYHDHLNSSVFGSVIVVE